MIQIIFDIVRVAQEIQAIAEAVAKNRRSCSRLAERIYRLIPYFQTFSNNKTVSEVNARVLEALLRLYVECKDFLEKFKPKLRILKKVVDLVGKAWNRNEHAEKFVDIHNRLNDLLVEIGAISAHEASVMIKNEVIPDLRKDFDVDTMENLVNAESLVESGTAQERLNECLNGFEDIHRRGCEYLQTLDRTIVPEETITQVIRSKVTLIIGKSMIARAPLKRLPVYDVDEELTFMSGPNRGAFGDMYQMIDKRCQQVYAVKKIEVNFVRNQGMTIEQVADEAATLNRLSHVNIVRLYQYMFTEDETRFYLLMEWIHGNNLSSRISPSVTIPEDLLWSWLRQVISALVHIHGERVLHRDLKPENIMVTSRDEIKLVDFGLSGTVKSSIGGAMSIVGTPIYSSYEKSHGLPYDSRDDVWAVGCVFVELLLHERLQTLLPRQVLSSLSADVTARHNEIIERCNGVNASITSIIRLCLHRDVIKRPQSAEILLLMSISESSKTPLPISSPPSLSMKPLSDLTIVEVKSLFLRRYDIDLNKPEIGRLIGSSLIKIADGRSTLKDYDILSLSERDANDIVDDLKRLNLSGVSFDLLQPADPITPSGVNETITRVKSDSSTIKNSEVSAKGDLTRERHASGASPASKPWDDFAAPPSTAATSTPSVAQATSVRAV